MTLQKLAISLKTHISSLPILLVSLKVFNVHGRNWSHLTGIANSFKTVFRNYFFAKGERSLSHDLKLG